MASGQVRRRHKVTFVTVVPSPYQRDLLGALAAREDIELNVCYMETASPDSPWPEAPLRPFERIMPGFWIPFFGARWHFNWRLPHFSAADIVVLSSFSSWTGQWLMRYGLRNNRWLFWGERLRHQTVAWRQIIQRTLSAPLAQASGIVGIGSAAEFDYSHRFPGTRHFDIPYHCDLSAFFAIPRKIQTDRPFTFFFCGQMIWRKGVDLLIIAFDRLVAKGIDARLLLVGREGNLPEFLTPICSATKARIRYEGFKAPDQLPRFFSQSDVFILPSRHDGWGVVINQALGAGLPVISSDAAGAGFDLVEEGINGLRFASGDLDDLQRCMEHFVINPHVAFEWGQASRRKALMLTPEAGAEKWAHVFDSLASGQ